MAGTLFSETATFVRSQNVTTENATENLKSTLDSPNRNRELRVETVFDAPMPGVQFHGKNATNFRNLAYSSFEKAEIPSTTIYSYMFSSPKFPHATHNRPPCYESDHHSFVMDNFRERVECLPFRPNNTNLPTSTKTTPQHNNQT